MKKTVIQTEVTRMLADIHTPVGIYLRLRDRFRDTVLLESTDNRAAENSRSFICVNAVAGIEVDADGRVETKYPGRKPEVERVDAEKNVPSLIKAFMERFEPVLTEADAAFSQGLFGYTGYDSVRFFDDFKSGAFRKTPSSEEPIPLIRYRLYQYVIVIDHYRDELLLCENRIEGLRREAEELMGLIRRRDVPQYPFRAVGEETSNMDDETYLAMVRKGIAHCHRGDVFQVVMSRRFSQGYAGDDFNVYRALRHVNPSPYLFYFDYGDYRIMGSSPESQLVVAGGRAKVHPIAGTFRRSGDEETDRREAARLLDDPKENAEHVMLVDLARNDLSRLCDDVSVNSYRQVQFYSHVIHLVSEVSGRPKPGIHPYELLAKTFPAGTLSGAPKVRAMEIIEENEPTPRSWYGGAIGCLGFDGSCNQAIIIRSFLSRRNVLTCQAGAGIVKSSIPESELQEVSHKLGALKKAVALAEGING